MHNLDDINELCVNISQRKSDHRLKLKRHQPPLKLRLKRVKRSDGSILWKKCKNDINMKQKYNQKTQEKKYLFRHLILSSKKGGYQKDPVNV